MRWLLGTLLASSHHSRHRPLALFGADGQPQLAGEEYEAIAGVWRADLELDDGDMAMSLHLAMPPHSSQQFDGRVYPMVEELPFNICRNNDGWSSARWSVEREVCAGAEGDHKLWLLMQLGNLYLEGRGERSGLRCPAFAGTVYEGSEDPCVVGRFSMQLSLPIRTDIGTLEARYQERIASRRPPPLTYPRSGFLGRWGMLLSVEDDSLPVYFPVELSDDGWWQSVGTEQTLAGTWGMISRDPYSGRSTTEPAGSSLWLSVHRESSSETLRGIAGLAVRSDFEMVGKPDLGTVEKQLAARASGITSGGTSAVLAERVHGRLSVGETDREYFGRFSLLRENVAVQVPSWGKAPRQGEQAQQGWVEATPRTVPKEEEAKRAWLAGKREWATSATYPRYVAHSSPP